jgi:hypothetical protein
MSAAIKKMYEALKPGGVLLRTSPDITRHRGNWKGTWYGSRTEYSIRKAVEP